MWTNTDGMQEDLHSPCCPWELSKPPKDQQRETLHSPGNSKHWKLGIQTENIYIYHPAVTDIHWPSDLFPSIKLPEKQSLPQMESLISHCPQIPFSFHLRECQQSPQPGPLDIWANGSRLDTQQGSSVEPSSLWALEFLNMFKQTKTTTFLSPFRTFPMTLHAPTQVTVELPPPWVH